ncbi:MAG: thioredoxin domain-containing protein, partial [Acidimicrobiales bacterium]
GKFYVWSPEQIHAVLGDDAGEFMNWFGVNEEGNFDGKNILWRQVRGDIRRPAGVELSRQRLFQAREMRIRPGLDDKVLTEWNGLMLASLAEAALVTSNHQWLGAATKNGDFLLSHLRRDDGRWLRSWQAGTPDTPAQARHLAYAADLAALVDAFTRLGEATGRSRWTEAARDAADQLLALFWDDEHGGVFTTGSDAPQLIARQKDITDNAVPSANSATAVALLRLAALTGNDHYRKRAEDIFRLVGPIAAKHPTSFGHLVGGFNMLDAGFTEIVIPGDSEELLDTARTPYLPDAVLAWGEAYDSPLWLDREAPNAYVCRNFTCGLPATSAAELEAALGTTRGPSAGGVPT